MKQKKTQKHTLIQWILLVPLTLTRLIQKLGLLLFEHISYLFLAAALSGVIGGIVAQEFIFVIAGIILSIGIGLYKKHVIFGSDKSAVIGTLILIALVAIGIGIGVLMGAW